MSRVARLLLAALVAAACDTDTIDLLPATTGGSGGQSGAVAGSSSSEQGGFAGTADTPQGGGGSASGGGVGGSNVAGCGPFGCGGFGGRDDGDVGGESGYQTCDDKHPCPFGRSCNHRLLPPLGVCLPKCESDEACLRNKDSSGWLCDEERTCFPCRGPADCKDYPYGRHVCVNGSCEECLTRDDCFPKEICDQFNQCVK